MTSWLDVGAHDEIAKRRKVVVEHEDHTVFVFVHDGEVRAFENVCIHKQRELIKGVILNGRIICPGHQWAFELDSGWEAKMQRCQPNFDVRVEEGRVLVDLDSARRRVEATLAAHGVDATRPTEGVDTAQPTAG